jgi:sarcosine oxidase gamma subunit
MSDTILVTVNETPIKIQVVPTLPFSTGGATDHAALNNLSYATALHTGFEPTVTKGNLSAGSSKISIGGTGTGAVIGAGASVDVAEANITHNNIGGLNSGDYQHLSAAQVSALHPAVTISDTNSIDLSLTGQALSADLKTQNTTNITLAVDASGLKATASGLEPTVTKGNLSELTSAILTIGGGTGAVIGAGATITVQQADTTHAGYLPAADWNTFNGKQPALSIGNLSAGSTKITIGGTGTGAVIGAGASVDVNQANLDHGSIGGLSDDDHTQYALLAGRVGGQTITGNLTLTDGLYLSALTANNTTGILYRGTSRFLHSFFPTNSTGSNVFLGALAGNLTMTCTSAQSDSLTGIGANVLKATTTSRCNTGIGESALSATQDGSYNVAIGSSSSFSNVSGTKNVAIGHGAFYGGTGSNNLALGSQAMFSTGQTGGNNVAIGMNALKGTNGNAFSNNIGIGYAVGDNITTASNCILIGYDLDALSATTNGQLRIGPMIYGSCTSPETVYFQPTADSVTFFQVLDADGGDPVLSVDVTNERVGIRCADPGNPLDVNGNARFRAVSSGTYDAPLNITSTGILTTATSDRRWKQNIAPIAGALNKVMALQGVYFDWIEGNGGRQIGLIAQDVLPIVPEVVYTNKVDGYYGLRYDNLIGLLIEAIKELEGKLCQFQQAPQMATARSL